MPVAPRGAQRMGTERSARLCRASPASSEPPSPRPGASDPPRCPTGARSRDQPLRDEDGCQRMEVSDSAGRCRDGPSAPDRPRQAGPGPTPRPDCHLRPLAGPAVPCPGRATVTEPPCAGWGGGSRAELREEEEGGQRKSQSWCEMPSQGEVGLEKKYNKEEGSVREEVGEDPRRDLRPAEAGCRRAN